MNNTNPVTTRRAAYVAQVAELGLDQAALLIATKANLSPSCVRRYLTNLITN